MIGMIAYTVFGYLYCRFLCSYWFHVFNSFTNADNHYFSWNAQCLFVYKVAGTVVERKSKEEVVMMTEQLTPIVRTNSKESVLVTEYRKQLKSFDGRVDPGNVSAQQLAVEKTVILDSLKSDESPILLSKVLGDILFNSVMVMETLKSALDIAFGYLDQRVTILIVSPDFDLGLKEYDKVCAPFSF